ncbi:MAG: hypothetical protein OEZ22_14915 [Spirochaetia bacterium]|nr:hypothetical protein [Spirochaetia bacterium]
MRKFIFNFSFYYLAIFNSSVFSQEKEIQIDYNNKEYVLYANMNGYKGNEKIIIKTQKIKIDEYDTEFKLIIEIYEKNKKVFEYNYDQGDRLGDHYVHYLKIVNFKGHTVASNRDIIFFMVAGCEAHLHMLHYKRERLRNSHKSEGKYLFNKYIAQVVGC